MKSSIIIDALSLSLVLSIIGFQTTDAFAAGASYGLQGSKITKSDKQ